MCQAPWRLALNSRPSSVHPPGARAEVALPPPWRCKHAGCRAEAQDVLDSKTPSCANAREKRLEETHQTVNTGLGRDDLDFAAFCVSIKS